MPPASPTDATSAPDWLGACRRAAKEVAGLLAASSDQAERTEETGTVGEGGDRTLVLDKAAEDAVFRQLEALHDAGARFTVVSEERGRVDFGSSDVLVVVDPIDGSTNAKRGLPHHALSIAVAEGDTMADVVFGFVYDVGPDEEWHATRGEGAYVDGRRIAPQDERRRDDGRLELVAIESARPEYFELAAAPLRSHVHRLRAIGAIAVSLCQVADTRVDAMATLWRCRSVDAAAAQLIVREAGGLVAFGSLEHPLDAPLDLEPRDPVVAARSPEGLAQMLELPIHWPATA